MMFRSNEYRALPGLPKAPLSQQPLIAKRDVEEMLRSNISVD